jgi:hypothetical protein
MFDNILKRGLRQGIVPARTKAAREWYRDAASSLTTKITSTQALKRSASRVKPTMEFGLMYAFSYDPKWKKELPYYDVFPLVFPVQFDTDSFLGINFHYLPHVLRARLMDALYPNVTNRKFDDTTRMRISYEILQSASKYRFFKPTLKRYLRTQIRSQFLEIDATEWDIALFLPTESFRKATKDKVWEESRKQIGR